MLEGYFFTSGKQIFCIINCLVTQIMYYKSVLSLQANRFFFVCVIVVLWFGNVNGWNTQYALVDRSDTLDNGFEMVTLDHERFRRDAPNASIHPPSLSPSSENSTASSPVVNTTKVIATVSDNSSVTIASAAALNDTDTNKTIYNASSLPSPSSTTIPLLGRNGTGIFKGNIANKTPKVSDPILPDDNLTSVFKETPELIKAEHNLTNLKYDNHTYYTSTFIGNVSFFNEHWENITKPIPFVHEMLSNSHRRATTLKLKFVFPYYGHPLTNVTVATGGFIFTGDHAHNWLAATQYIAPLMANFDTTKSLDSFVNLYDDGEKFTALWENVNLQDDPEKNFTFAVTLYKNGDITFAYKDIPIPVTNISDMEHPVKVGISDAYITDKIMFYVRRKAIYEYDRVSFTTHEISNCTLLKLIALPTCQQYNSCDSCLNHNTTFNCSWCAQIQKCSSGTDRSKQDWMLRNCDKLQVTNASMCSAYKSGASSYEDDHYISYETNTNKQASDNDTVIARRLPVFKSKVSAPQSKFHINNDSTTHESHSPIGGLVAAFLIVTLVTSIAAWVLYAFKHPHTRSGQLLIKYRPSMWSWRRGEARYTAATIHM